MNKLKRISKVFESAEEIPYDDSSRIILMSDVHRGDGATRVFQIMPSRNAVLKRLNLNSVSLPKVRNPQYELGR